MNIESNLFRNKSPSTHFRTVILVLYRGVLCIQASIRLLVNFFKCKSFQHFQYFLSFPVTCTDKWFTFPTFKVKHFLTVTLYQGAKFGKTGKPSIYQTGCVWSTVIYILTEKLLAANQLFSGKSQNYIITIKISANKSSLYNAFLLGWK